MISKALKGSMLAATLLTGVASTGTSALADPADEARAILRGDVATSYAQWGHGRGYGGPRHYGYRQGGRHYGHRGYRGGNNGAAIGAGIAALAAGAIIGGLAAQAAPQPHVGYYGYSQGGYGHGGYGRGVYADDGYGRSGYDSYSYDPYGDD